MKDFIFRNDTKLLFRNDICETVSELTKEHKVMFVYGSGSVKRNGCHSDIVRTMTANMTTYTGLVTLVQLSSAILGDKNKMSYDAGISYIRNVLEATKVLQEEPDNLDARGIIMIGASLSTSSRLGIGKENTFAYDIYELEFLPEKLFGSSYRRSLTSMFPRFLSVMSRHYADDIRKYFSDAFGFTSSIEESVNKLIELFSALGVPMYYEGEVSREQIKNIPHQTELNEAEVFEIINSLVKHDNN